MANNWNNGGYENNGYRPRNNGYNNNGGYNNYNYNPNMGTPSQKRAPQFGDKDEGGVFTIGQKVKHIGSGEYCWIIEFGRQQICVRTKDLRAEWLWPFEIVPADQ